MVASANEILQIAEKTISLKKIFLNFKNSSNPRLGEPFNSPPKLANFYFSLVKRNGDEYSISSLTHFLSYFEKKKIFKIKKIASSMHKFSQCFTRIEAFLFLSCIFLQQDKGN